MTKKIQAQELRRTGKSIGEVAELLGMQKSGSISKWWRNVTDISRTQFAKITLIAAKRKKVYADPEQYYGTLRITVNQGTELRRRIHGWIEGLGMNVDMPG